MSRAEEPHAAHPAVWPDRQETTRDGQGRRFFGLGLQVNRVGLRYRERVGECAQHVPLPAQLIHLEDRQVVPRLADVEVALRRFRLEGELESAKKWGS